MRIARSIVPVACLLILGACGGDTTGPDGPGDDPMGGAGFTDAQLFALSTGAGPWTWYKLTADTLRPGSNSPHGRFRTRYNEKAAALLDAQGKVLAGATFPDSSLIVKEIYSGTSTSLIAVMLKAANDPNAGGGWLWGEYTPAGQVVFSLSANPSVCTNCHGPGIDFTRMNDSHP